jgi:hypothetical protein
MPTFARRGRILYQESLRRISTRLKTHNGFFSFRKAVADCCLDDDM